MYHKQDRIKKPWVIVNLLLRLDLPGSEIIIAISAIALGAILSLEKSF
ncbi:hypothetical protein [Limnofasciculus baicalensis]|uniref:Uncharacterized protein n=1 Tax=Limnofasciculus baicalensis BBK-W-15 TaxID=2699891 RepID=A0AAE3GXJ3_9CYAN|nr:hypothetical protein [Limnofasciculus baicalensis]MCP2730462.1 hypothetical protein [Limnofasciculus baicalensis BBK-W-15]